MSGVTMMFPSTLRRHEKPQQNRGYLAHIRRQPCCVCGTTRGVQAAHTGARGLGQKACARRAIPLCAGHHKTGNDSYHALGPAKFAACHNLDIEALIAGYQRQGQLFESPHAIGRKQRSPGYTRYHCPCGWRSAWYAAEHDALFCIQSHVEEKNNSLRGATCRGDGSVLLASADNGSHGGAVDE